MQSHVSVRPLIPHRLAPADWDPLIKPEKDVPFATFLAEAAYLMDKNYVFSELLGPGLRSRFGLTGSTGAAAAATAAVATAKPSDM